MARRPEWERLLRESRTSIEEAARAAAMRRRAGAYLWAGAKALIETWNSDADPDGMALYAAAREAIGRRGDASKIKCVALATRDLDLHIECYGNLCEAYRNARRLAEAEDPLC